MGRLFCTHPTSSIRVSVEPERDLYEEEEEEEESGVLDCIQKKNLIHAFHEARYNFDSRVDG